MQPETCLAIKTGFTIVRTGKPQQSWWKKILEPLFYPKSLKNQLFSIVVNRYVNKQLALFISFVGYLLLGHEGGKNSISGKTCCFSPSSVVLIFPDMLGEKVIYLYILGSFFQWALKFFPSSSSNIWGVHVRNITVSLRWSGLVQPWTSEKMELKNQNCIHFQCEECLLKDSPSYFVGPWKETVHLYVTKRIYYT